MIKIWGRRNSLNVQKVLWFVNELDLPYENIPAGGSFGDLDVPEFLQMNPHGRIPLLLDEETAVWESHAILRYLAASYGEPQFWSHSAKTRSQVDAWMDWAQTSLQPDFLSGLFWGFYRTPELQRNWPAIRKSLEACNRHFQLLDNVLKYQPFLCGKDLTLADIPAGTILYRYFELDIERPSLPNVEAWYKRLQERPAYREHVMVPFSELQGRLEY